ncbi:MAG: ferrous iron transport protein A [Candidatus Marinimicrobia bacterium]|nr:ferrous iron transport protein A [Candidatus Neomarinimicrobiota bacterium]
MFNRRQKKRPGHQLTEENRTGLRLSDLRPGETGRIVEVGGSDQFRLRLIEMGLTRNAEIAVDKYAPLLDPMELIVMGYHLSIRAQDAEKIVVKRIDR